MIIYQRKSKTDLFWIRPFEILKIGKNESYILIKFEEKEIWVDSRNTKKVVRIGGEQNVEIKNF